MRNKKLFWMAPVLAIAMSSCTTLRPAPMDTAKACADWQWIGISQPGVPCPDVPGWDKQPLFPELASIRPKPEDYFKQEDAERVTAPVPAPGLIGELKRFCVYEAPPQSTGGNPLPPPASADLERIDRDCSALSGSGEKHPRKPWRFYSKRLLDQAGTTGETFTIDNPLGVRLAFLDTQPTRGDIPTRQGRSPHGYTLAHIARHLVCPGGSCAARITTRLALPIVDFDPTSRERTKIDTERGGFLGMQSDLAQAILSEVDAWREDPRQEHLVLNLSLAWDGELFGGLDEAQVDEMRAGNQAVYRALQYASGFDALVLAAAGNQKGEPCANFGPLLPAAWESGELRERTFSSQSWDVPPRLYAVGGVDAKGYPVVNARPGGMPRRVAYADSAVVACPNRKGRTAMLTGSSVAAAVVSSIASVVWAAHPNLSSRKIMEILDASGEALPMAADFWPPASAGASTSPPQVHKVSLCSALAKACDETGCASRPTCASHALESRRPWLPFQARTWRAGSCQPWLYPQPEVDPCPVCPPWKP